MNRSAMLAIGTLLLVFDPWPPAAMAATDAAKQAAIHNGLTYLYKTQQASGSWSDSGYEHAATGAAVFALLSQQDRWDTAGLMYQNAVDKAIAYLLNSARVTDVSAREDGINICPDHAPVCKGIYWLDNKATVGTTAEVAQAIATYGVKHGPDAIAATGGPLAGMTWAQIAQGITNGLAASQSTGKDAGVDGAWLLATASGARPDRWGVQPAIISFLYNQTLGAVTPQPVKTSISAWLSRVLKDSGCSDNANAGLCDPDNIGQWLLAFSFIGSDTSEVLVDQVVSELNRMWPSKADQRGRGNFGHPTTMWTLYAGLESVFGLSDTTHISNFLTDCGAAAGKRPTSLPDTSTCTWIEDYHEWIVTNQQPDGAWRGYSYSTGPIVAALYLNILGSVEIPNGLKCPQNQAYWQTPRAAWPVDALVLGRQTYTRNELLKILDIPVELNKSVDASLVLADELITAKLNIAHGSDKNPIAEVISNADALLATFTGSLPYQVAQDSATGQRIAEYASLLDTYNRASMTSGCADGPALKRDAPNRQGIDSRIQQPAALLTENAGAKAVASIDTAQRARLSASSTKTRPFTRKGATAIALNQDGTLLATASTDNHIRIWSPTTGQQSLVLSTIVRLPTDLTFSPDGSMLEGVGRDSLVRTWAAVSGSDLATFAGHENPLRALAASPDSRLIASGGEDTRILIWDTAARKLSGILYGSTDFVNSLDFSPDGTLLASAGEDAQVRLFDVAAGRIRFTLLGHSGPINKVSFSPDGRQLASAGDDTVIHVWDPAKGVQIRALAGHQAAIRALAFSADGQIMASGGEDARIILWNSSNGTISKTLLGSTGSINALVFDLHGRFLVSATDTGEISVWNTAAGIRILTFKIPI